MSPLRCTAVQGPDIYNRPLVAGFTLRDGFERPLARRNRPARFTYVSAGCTSRWTQSQVRSVCPLDPLACGWGASGSSIFETMLESLPSGTRDSKKVDGVERFFIAMAVAGALGFVATLSWMLIFH